MVEVFSRSIPDILRYLDEKGIEVNRACLAEVCGDVTALPKKIPWNHYASIMNRIDSSITKDREQVLRGFVAWSFSGRARWSLFIGVLAKGFVRPVQLYEFLRWLARTTFTAVDARLTVRSAEEIEFQLILQPGLEPIPIFFDMSVEAMRLLPGMIGYPPADVEVRSLSAKAAYFRIRLPLHVSFPLRVRNFLRKVFAPKRSQIYFSGGEQELHEEYEALLRSREVLEAEVRSGEARLAKSRSEYELLMENVPDVIVTINKDRTIDYINKTKPPWTREQVIGVNCLEFIPPDHRKSYDILLGKVFATGEPGGMDVPITDGTVSRVRLVPLYQDGQINRVMVISADVTQETRAASRLQEARDLAVASNNAKSAFLANVSHEIRTPITAILGFSELLRESPALRDADKAAARTIFNNSLHLKSLIDDLLDISKIEAGSIELAKDEFSAERLVSDSLELFSVQARAKGIELICENCEGPEERIVTGDMRRIKQILMNLIGNAVKFTESGFVSVNLELRPSANRPDARRFCVRIRDSGPGIDPAQQTRIFEAFEQGDQTFSKKQSGTGLGLFLSRQFAHLMNGEVWIESTQQGSGTTFCLEVEVSAVVRESVPSDARIPKVLVVEDNPDIARLLEIVVRAAGMDVHLEDRGDRAVESARKMDPDLIIMDLQLPVMNGYEAVQTLRSGGYQKPILGLTANARADDRQRCLALGFSDYLSKPVDRDDLIYKIRNLLGAAAPASPGGA